MPSREIDNTVKVYTRQLSSEPWVLNEKLTCLRVTDAYGLLQPHTAQLAMKTPNMLNFSVDTGVQTEIDNAKKAMRYNADVEFQITKTETGIPGIIGLWCQVTTERSGTEEIGTEVTIFIGQIVGNDFDFGSTMCDGLYALGLDWCLSNQSAVGSLCFSAGDDPTAYDHYDSVKPYFNPKSRPNRNEDSEGINVFDYALAININLESAYWKPSTIIAYLLERLNNQVIDAYPDEKRYEYFSTLTNTQLSLDNGDNVFTDEQKSDDYDMSNQSIWAALVQLIEVNGLYTLTIKYDSSDPANPIARLTVLELV